jgi:glycosyltransferase involved in cell wall biosynthesis
MKVVHVLETMSPNYGGPVSVLTQLAAEQLKSGLEVEILTTCSDYPRGEFHRPGWATLGASKVPVFYGGVDLQILKISIRFARELKKSIRNADLVHVHGLYRFPPSYAAYAARKAGKPYVIRPFGSLDPFLYSKSSKSLLLKRLYERLIDLPNLRGASALHFTAEEERRRASFLELAGRQVVIPNPIDLSRYESIPARGLMRQRWGVGNSPVVLFLGRLHHKKGLDLLIPAFKRVLDRTPTAKLVIAGPENDGHGAEMRALVKRLELEQSVLFCGALKGAEVLQALVDADVFALTSYAENFGMAVVEAMAAMTPVLISDQVNISPDVIARQAGIVTRCNVDEIAEGLSRLLSDPGLCAQHAGRAKSMVRDLYSLPAVTLALTKLYEGIVSEHSVLT